LTEKQDGRKMDAESRKAFAVAACIAAVIIFLACGFAGFYDLEGAYSKIILVWIDFGENASPGFRGPCFFISLVLMLLVGLVTPLACEGVEITRSPRSATALRLALAVSAAVITQGLFAVAVLCIDPEGDKFLVFGQAVLTLGAVLYASIRVSSSPVL
jgi:hypothetical protein